MLQHLQVLPPFFLLLFLLLSPSPSLGFSASPPPPPPPPSLQTRLSQLAVSTLTQAVNFGKPPPPPVPARVQVQVSPAELLAGLKSDFVDREYLWSGSITPELYGEDCAFSDPTLSFTGLSTFLENIRNLDPVLERCVSPKGVTSAGAVLLLTTSQHFG